MNVIRPAPARLPDDVRVGFSLLARVVAQSVDYGSAEGEAVDSLRLLNLAREDGAT